MEIWRNFQFAIFLLLFKVEGLRVGDVAFDPLNFEIWCDTKKLYLKGLDKSQQQYLFDGKNVFPLSDGSFPYCYIISNALSELALRSFIAFFKDASNVHWSDLIDEIPASDANLLLILPEDFWKSLDLKTYARLADMFPNSPLFDQMVSKFGPELVNRSMALNVRQLMAFSRRGQNRSVLR